MASTVRSQDNLDTDETTERKAKALIKLGLSDAPGNKWLVKAHLGLHCSSI